MQEIGVELRHDIVVRNAKRAWCGSDLTHLDEALTGLPSGWNPADGKAITFADVETSAPGDKTGGVTDPDNTITMYAHGLGSGGYMDTCPSLKGLTAHKHSIRHEIGHTIHNRMRAKADELFAALDWHEYSPANKIHRESLAKETALDGEKLDKFLEAIKGKRIVRNGRTFFRHPQSGLAHSFGKPAEVPETHEFDYAYWSQSEYFAEIYSYLVDDPALMKSRLSEKQLGWWKDKVFGGTLPA
jgi:hypothetical protein